MANVATSLTWKSSLLCAVELAPSGLWGWMPASSTRSGVLDSVPLPTQGRPTFSNPPVACPVQFFQWRFYTRLVLKLSTCSAFLSHPRTQDTLVHDTHLSLNFRAEGWSTCQGLPSAGFRSTTVTELSRMKYASEHLTLSCALGKSLGKYTPELPGPKLQSAHTVSWNFWEENTGLWVFCQITGGCACGGHVYTRNYEKCTILSERNKPSRVQLLLCKRS